MSRRAALVALYLLLGCVAAAAAVLSFTALRDLAIVCGFAPGLAWLLPIVVDAGAAAGSLVWLARWTPAPARQYGRTLALLLLAGSVGGNALGHGLAAYNVRPHWAVVVAVSAIAPAVLAALVHLAVLVVRASPPAPPPSPPDDAPAGDDRAAVPPTSDQSDEVLVADVDPGAAPAPASPAEPGDRAADLIAAGAGRRKLSRELQITEHEAREMLARARNGHDT